MKGMFTKMIIKKSNPLIGKIKVDGDKSISHRAVMFSSICEGESEIQGFLMGEDCIRTIKCLQALGIKIAIEQTKIIVYGKGLYGLSKPTKALYVGNSGTSIRLLSGLLAGQKFDSEIYGDESICKRPMNRIITPLKLMQGNIESNEGGFAPLKIIGSRLEGIKYKMPVASAQVKSAILLASLYAKTETKIEEPLITRNHTEIMLNYLGGKIESIDKEIKSNPVEKLQGNKIEIGGDISSAAYFIVAGLIVRDSHIVIEKVNVNETRTGLITALKKMGGNIVFKNEKIINGEKTADIEVKYSKLKGTKIGGGIIPLMIDEIPIFAVACACAEGESIIKNAEELKIKESNRIKTMVTELKKMNVKIAETEDGMFIEGGSDLKGSKVLSYNDHRVAMSLAIAGLCSEGETEIDNSECVNISFPNFEKCLKVLTN